MRIIDKPVIERKICYDGTIVEHPCTMVEGDEFHKVLFHKIEHSFSMETEAGVVTIPSESYTIAHYWKDRPYNVYIWRNSAGEYIGSYFNFVKDTYFHDGFIIFEDLILDLLVMPNGEFFFLDEDELPLPLEKFEDGYLLGSIEELLESLPELLSKLITNKKSL